MKFSLFKLSHSFCFPDWPSTDTMKDRNAIQLLSHGDRFSLRGRDVRDASPGKPSSSDLDAIPGCPLPPPPRCGLAHRAPCHPSTTFPFISPRLLSPARLKSDTKKMRHLIFLGNTVEKGGFGVSVGWLVGFAPWKK